MDLTPFQSWFRERLLDRFIRYVRFDTVSDRHNPVYPSTPGQRVFATALREECEALGGIDVTLDEHCYLFAVLPASADSRSVPPLGLIAHLDTSSDAPGKNVSPQVHERYTGGKIALNNGVVLDPAEFPDLQRYIGQTVITSDGTTLLGADDKAGVAEIMTVLEFFLCHPEFSHGRIEVVFTPDEETGRGMNRFPREKFTADFCLTLDGSGDGDIEAECFTAYELSVTAAGRAIHLGEARGKLVNAVELAAALVTLLPKEESPQTTDGRDGYYAPIEIKGDIEQASLDILIRDFSERECRRRITAVRETARTLEKLYPGAALTVTSRRQYGNMKSFLGKNWRKRLALLRRAVRNAGGEPVETSIRGGTDGARLSEMGVPTPNLFTGGYNYHSRREWAALPAMVRAVMTVLYVADEWRRI
ncbi:MAG TPA: peptidase T [Spirochaetia bacterium]|mgnify:CR=1 FL=1|nr:peptidase T [Spirochaetia bacterium]